MAESEPWWRKALDQLTVHNDELRQRVVKAEHQIKELGKLLEEKRFEIKKLEARPTHDDLLETIRSLEAKLSDISDIASF